MLIITTDRVFKCTVLEREREPSRHNTNHCKSNFIPLQVVGMSLSTVGSWRWCGVNVYRGPKEQYWTTGHEAIWPVLNVPLNCDTFRGISYSRIHRRRHKGIVVTQGIRTNKSHFLLARNETQSYEFNREIWTPRRPINPSFLHGLTSHEADQRAGAQNNPREWIYIGLQMQLRDGRLLRRQCPSVVIRREIGYDWHALQHTNDAIYYFWNLGSWGPYRRSRSRERNVYPWFPLIGS